MTGSEFILKVLQMSKTVPFPQGPKIRVMLEFTEFKLKKTLLSLADRFECAIEGKVDQQCIDTLLAFLKCYGQREHAELELPLDMLSPFRQKVLQNLQKVGFGSIVTYGELAHESGHPGAARAVGTACHFNPFPLFIPCHRVITSGRKIGGFAYNLEIKRRLLEFENCSATCLIL
jgi:O-6-methylguanine DNA methyltransferase